MTTSLVEFLNFALSYKQHPQFEEREIDYKVRLSIALQSAVDVLVAGSPEWFTRLRQALNSRDNNIVSWRDTSPFLRWCAANSEQAREVLGAFWNTEDPMSARFETFSIALDRAGIDQVGSQLCLGSTLLMALTPFQHPPVRTRVFQTAFRDVGFPPFPPNSTATDRYLYALAFLDNLIEEADRIGQPLTNRLEAQAVVWCATGGWEPPPVYVNNYVADLDEDAEKEILAEVTALSQLQETERQAIVAARRGQGKFRQALFDFWHGCAVTGCTRTGVLKASHLKPWRLSTNQERLDKFNGLLLTPNLDTALDRCLIAFDDDGEILISPVLSSKDLQSLSLDPQMKLRRLDRQHLPYLAFHRHLFENRAKALNLAPDQAEGDPD